MRFSVCIKALHDVRQDFCRHKHRLHPFFSMFANSFLVMPRCLCTLRKAFRSYKNKLTKGTPRTRESIHREEYKLANIQCDKTAKSGYSEQQHQELVESDSGNKKKRKTTVNFKIALSTTA